MPAFDFPLEELKRYKGCNPRPADFDSYWDTALKELDSLDPNPELVPADDCAARNTECFHLWFTGVGGARIHAKYLRPKSASNCPAVLRFHGYSMSSGDWSDGLSFSGEGFCVASMDCRGQGGLSQDLGGADGMTLRGHFVRGLEDSDPKKLLFRAIYLDTVQLARVVAGLEEVDETRMGAMGGSQGGALTIACAALYPGIRRAFSVHPFLSDFKRVWDMDLAKDAYEELSYFLRARDPLHQEIDEVFTKLGYIDVHHLAPRVKAKTFLLFSLMDQVCPPSSQFAVYNNLNCEKDCRIYPDFAHEYLPGLNDLALEQMLSM